MVETLELANAVGVKTLSENKKLSTYYERTLRGQRILKSGPRLLLSTSLGENLISMRRRSSKTTVSEGKLTPEELRKRTFERAVKLLAAKARSVADLRERLLAANGSNEAVVETVISRLREYGYLDDERFAFSYASLKVKQKPIGRRRLERDLKFKKVASEVAEEALELVYAETSEEDLIDKAIERRIRLRGRPTDRKEAKSLFDHLLRQGFSFELVSEKVRAAAKELDEE